MNVPQENTLSMYLAVKTVCDKAPTVWQTLPAFQVAYLEFIGHLNVLNALAPSQGRRKSGATVDKQRLREEMCDLAFEIGSATLAWAQTNKNGDLANKVDYSSTDLLGGRDTRSASRSEEILAAATSVIASLADHGVTPAKLTNLQGKITAYRAVLPKPREARTSGKTATTRLAAEFRAANKILNERMDNLVPQLRAANATFVSDYLNARRTVNASASHKKAPTTPPEKA